MDKKYDFRDFTPDEEMTCEISIIRDNESHLEIPLTDLRVPELYRRIANDELNKFIEANNLKLTSDYMLIAADIYAYIDMGFRIEIIIDDPDYHNVVDISVLIEQRGSDWQQLKDYVYEYAMTRLDAWHSASDC